MSIARIGETQAKPEAIESLREFLLSIMPGIGAAAGCESVTLYHQFSLDSACCGTARGCAGSRTP